MVFILWLIFFAFFCFHFIKKKDTFDPEIWLAISVVFLLGMYYFGGVSYSYKLTTSGLLYFLANVFVFFVFCGLGKRSKITLLDVDKCDNYVNKHYKMLLIVGYIGAVLSITDIVSFNNIHSVAAILSSHDDFRNGILGTIGSFLYPVLLLCWLFDIIQIANGEKKFKLIYFVNLMCFVIPNILTSGRQGILFAMLCTIIAIIPIFKNKAAQVSIILKRNKKKLLAFTIGLLIIVVLYMVFVASERNTFENKLASMISIFGVRLNDQAYNLCTKYGWVSVFMLEFLFYYTHELPNLQFLISEYHGPYGFGGYQFHYVFRRLSFLGVDPNVVENNLKVITRSNGIANHTYRTIIGSAICDYGLIGTLFFIALLGWYCGWRYRKYRYCESIMNKTGMVLICAAILFSIEYSPFRETIASYCMIWLIMLRFGNRLKRRTLG